MISGRKERRERLAAASMEKVAKYPGPHMRPGRPEAMFARICERVEREGGVSRREARKALSVRGRGRRVAVALVMSMLLLVLMSSSAFALSYDASPGSALYGTKLFFERVRLSLTPGDYSKAAYRLRLTEKRLGELEKMVAAGKEKGGPAWESAYRREVRGLLDQVSELPEEARERFTEEAADRLREQARRMEMLGSASPGSLGGHVRNANEFCDGAARCMRERCVWGEDADGQGGQGGREEHHGGGGGMQGETDGGGGHGYHGGDGDQE